MNEKMISDNSENFNFPNIIYVDKKKNVSNAEPGSPLAYQKIYVKHSYHLDTIKMLLDKIKQLEKEKEL